MINNINNSPSFAGSGNIYTNNAAKFSRVDKACAKAEAAILKNEKVIKTVGKIAGSKKINIIDTLAIANSLLISGMYIVRTLQNDKLDSKKKKTLAINQACVAGVSTVLGQTLSKSIDKRVDKFADNFKVANFKEMDKALGGNAKSVSDSMGMFTGGIKAAKSLVIFGLIYRYISPVLVTPVANKLGRKIEEMEQVKQQMNNNNVNKVA